ncbi:MAG: DNA helicase RecQ [Bacteroidota bacterium]
MTVELAKAALKKYFGYDQFRPMQEEIISSVYEGKDVVVLMPTGGGKSMCYQIPAITMDGVCIVVSPLISLMKDQVESLRASGIPAAYLNSSLSSREQQVVEDDLYNQNIQLLYVSPEKMVSQQFMPLLQQARINLFAIDEAHCISAWGHDFRPEYTQLRFLKRQFKGIPVIALTATADKLTRKDIVEQLELQQPKVFTASFDRPNISLEVRPGQKRMEQILHFIGQRPNQSGIIYCLSRKNTEDVANKLNKKGISAAFYHAGLDARSRNQVQEDFISDRQPIVCATVAFGMGIDKSNVRWIIHYNLPKNMESYYQEIGRAGRDGTKADTLLFYSFADVAVLREILQRNESEHLDIKLAKLDRMRQYADSLLCRRKILLNYFGEDLQENCGNCDICKNPPQQFDGTIIAQKALSAIARLGERVGMTILIDVLRGSRRKDIFQRGYHKIKTYGAGADISSFDWQVLLQQMVNQGLIEVAYDQHNVLRLTPASRAVLFEGRKVELVKMQAIRERIEAKKAAGKVKTQRQRVRDELFEVLRQLRRQLALKSGVPPYIVFSDATLEEMAAVRPMDEVAMREVSGVGEMKLKKYGYQFIKAIRQFVQAARVEKEQKAAQSDTQIESLQLFRRGLSIEEIALRRELSVDTIYNHLINLYTHSEEEFKISSLVSKKEIKRVLEVSAHLAEPYKLREIYEQLNEEISYPKIKFALAYKAKHPLLSN